MRKRLLTLLTILIIAMLTACGSSEGSVSEETNTKEAEAEEDDTEYATETYMGMTFSLPADWTHQENGNSIALTSTDSEAMVMLQSIDLSVSDDEYDDKGIETLFEASFMSVISGYEDVQEGDAKDLTVAGCKAQEMEASVTLSDTEMNDDILAIYDENGQYIYIVQYLVKNEVEENTRAYEHFLDSISFDAEAKDDAQKTESDDVNNSSKNDSRSSDIVQSEDGYDITYQSYELYEDHSGDPHMNAIVEIKNTGDTNLQLKSSTFTLTDDKDSLIGVCSYTNEDPKVIMPGEYGYIYSYAHTLDGEDIDINGGYNFVPELSIQETDKEPVFYEVSDLSISAGKYDKADIMGRITNPTDEDKSILWLSFALYDKDDKPIAVYGTNIEDLAAGETKGFDADAANLVNLDFTYDDVARYEVFARN